MPIKIVAFFVFAFYKNHKYYFFFLDLKARLTFILKNAFIFFFLRGNKFYI